MKISAVLNMAYKFKGISWHFDLVMLFAQYLAYIRKISKFLEASSKIQQYQ
jgi:hypothetical protein